MGHAIAILFCLALAGLAMFVAVELILTLVRNR